MDADFFFFGHYRWMFPSIHFLFPVSSILSTYLLSAPFPGMSHGDTSNAFHWMDSHPTQVSPASGSLSRRPLEKAPRRQTDQMPESPALV